MSESGSKRAGNLSIEKQALLVLQMKKRKAAEAAAARTAAGIPRRAAAGRPPLSLAQQRLWLQDRLDPGSTAYNIPYHSRLRGPLDVSALAAAVGAIVRRHESLRTRFTVEGGGGGEPVQVIGVAEDFPLPVIDLTALTAGARQRAEPELIAGHLLPFDLERGPLFRASLARLSAEEHILLVDIHHIVSDGWSFGVFFRELAELYAAFRDDRDASLPELPIQYADFAVWQRERLQGPVLEEQLVYWRERLQGAPALLELPLDRTRPAIQSHRGASAHLDLPSDLVARLRELALREGATPFMLHLAAFQLLLSRLAGQDDVVVGSPSAGRNRREIEGLIGLFLNTLVLRTELSGEPTFRELLGRVKQNVLGAYQYQEVPFERLLEELQPERQLSHTPIFQVLFNFVSLSHLGLSLQGLTVEPIESTAESKFDFTLYVNELADSLHLELVYDTELFDPDRMSELLRQLQHLLVQVAAEPDRKAGEISLVTPGPSGSVSRLPDAGRSLSGAWYGPIHAALARGAAAHPERLAVEDAQGVAWSYGELDARANRLAHRLLAGGVEKGEVVAVWSHRGAPLLQALLGTCKAGAAMMILDPSYPVTRLLDYLRIGRPTAWVALPGAAAVPPEVEELAALCRCRIELTETALQDFPEGDPGVVVEQDDPACITFTSGSTGLPKGVVGRHGPLTHYYPWMSERFALAAEDRFGVLSALSHDPLQRDLFTPLWLGAAIVLPDPERIGAPGYLARWLLEQSVTVVHLTPAMMELVLESAADGGADSEGLVEVAELPALRRAFVVGDLLKKGNVRRLLELAPSLLCVNLYGSTETQRSVSIFPVPREPELERIGKEVLPLGRGMEGCQLLVLNPAQGLAGVGEPGEIYVRSRHLAEGYLGDEVLTAQRFLPNPLAAHPAAEDRAYRTGDLGRYLPDGGVEMIGRADFQVKLRGFRIELGEVEAALARHPAIRETVVVVREDRAAERGLVAYAVPATADSTASEAPSPRELRDFLAARLPDYMVPAAFVLLPALPLTATGKVDRRALPAPAAENRPERAEEQAAARSPVEELLAGVWSELLGTEAVAPQQSFFELGGHSLLATRMLSRVRTLFGVELPLRSIFLQPTLAGFATLVERARQEEAGSEGLSLVRVSRGEPLPTSFAQQRLWFLDRLEPGGSAYNLAGAVRLAGSLEVPALAAALGAIVARHESLRTVFLERSGEPWQVILEPGPLLLPLIDLAALPAADKQTEWQRVALAEGRRPYDLAHGPLFRFSLLRLGTEEWVLTLGLHHIIADGWSVSVLVRELGNLYRASVYGDSSLASTLRELPVQYADYAVWQRQILAGAVMEERLAWWRHQLAGAPQVIDLPLDHPRPVAQSYRGRRANLAISPEATARLEGVARRLGVTPFMAMLAAFATLLSRYGSQDDVVVGSPIANRGRAELEDLIGLFVNTLALPVHLAGDPAFADLAQQLRHVALGAYARQDVPFERLVDELRPDRSLSHAPVFQVMLAYQNLPESELDLAGITLSPLELDFGRTQFDLSLFLFPEDGGLLARMEYARDLFDAATVERLLFHLRNLLAGIAEAPERRLSELPLLAPEERSELLAAGSQTEVEIPDLLLHQLFEALAAERPGVIAVRGEGTDSEPFTYAELNARANRLAHHLRSLGVGPESLVAVCLERSSSLIASLLAVLKAGGAYIPLDPAYPADRVAWVLEDSHAALLLTQSSLLSTLPVHEGRTVLLDEVDLAGQSSNDPEALAGPENLAYVIYTSGSTGRPKGVAVRQRGAVNFLASMARRPGLEADDVLLAVTTVAFDIALLELFLPLSHGARIELVGKEVAADGFLLLERLATSGATVLQATPATWRLLLEAGWAGSPGLKALCGGEALPPDLARELLTRSRELWNVYGPTETTVWSTLHPVAEADLVEARPVPLGDAVANTEIYLLGRFEHNPEPVPRGAPGELYLGGEGLARGYLGRPDLTAERFVPNPFANTFGVYGARLYRTGDLVRRRPSTGALEFLGRTDQQVKIRGFRIELGEIETALAGHPAVRETVVVAREVTPGSQSLVAYLAFQQGAEVPFDSLRSYLRQTLPDYMVPAHFVALPALPLTPNGKVDRRALPAPGVEPQESERDGARSPVEELLAGIWAELLGVSGVALRQSFFDLGGHSLLATRMISRVRTVLGADLPLRTLFEEPTLSGFAAAIEKVRDGGGVAEAPPLVRVPRGVPLPTSFAQQRLWFLDRLDPESSAYNLAGAVRLEGGLNVPSLAVALSAIVERHEALRTVFAESAGEPWQVVLPRAPLPLPVVDLSGLPEAPRHGEARRIALDEGQRPYSLSRGPLFRYCLLRLGELQHDLTLGLHHIISDGWSIGILIRELGDNYRALALGEPIASALRPELPVQYADYAAWQRQLLSGAAMEERLGWWRDQLAGIPQVIDLPLDRPRPGVQSYQGGRAQLAIDPASTARLEGVARRLGVTSFMTLAAGLATLFSRYGSQDDIVLGTPIANRGRAELEELIGFFVNTLPLRIELSGDPTFGELAHRVRQRALGAYARQDVPFERLVDELRPDRSLSHAPVFQVMLAYQNLPESELDLAGITLSPLELDFGRTQFDLSLFLFPEDGGLLARMEYARDLFDAATVERLLFHLRNLLAGIAEAPERRLSELPLLAPEERSELLAAGSQTEVEIPDLLLHQLFEALAAERPGAIAVRGEGTDSEPLTYAELNARANRLAHHLRSLGVGPESLVAVCLERSSSLLAALLAVLKAGGAYIPLDPAYPADRVAWVLEDSRAALLLTQSSLLATLPVHEGRTVLLDEVDLSGQSSKDPESVAASENLAYVIYTSGSTGRPKGVAVRQRGAVNFLTSMARRPGLEADDVLLAVTTVAFDIALLELFLPLSRGARIDLVGKEVAADGFLLLERLATSGATVLQATPATWRLLLEAGWPGSPGLKALCGGEALPPDLARELLTRSRELWNVYGPTETTVWSTLHPVSEADLVEARPVPLGDAVANTEIYLLGRFEHNPEPVPQGAPGELYLGGEGLARGYLGRPDLTAERFVPNPFAGISGSFGARLYRTGDLVRRRPSTGALEFLGRADQQVKIRGFRIELGEIETALSGHPAIRETVVVAREVTPGSQSLVAYLAFQQGAEVPFDSLRFHLRQTLPDYMVPAHFVELPALPLTPNGKVDRRALPAPSVESQESGRDGERSPVEELLAGIWAELLGVSGVASRQSFFDLGGHSLLATRMISRVRTVLGADLPLRTLFEEPTLSGFAAAIEKVRDGGGGAAAPPLVRVPRGEPLPASYTQRRLWFLQQLEPESFAYNLTGALRLEGELDSAALAAALGALQARHEALRTTFVESGGEPWQVIAAPEPWPLPIFGLTALPADRGREETLRIVRAEAQRPYDLWRGPLLRVSLVRLAPSENALIVGMHHVISDGWSMSVFVRELGELYRASVLGVAPELPELPVQFADFAVWQRRWLSGTEMERQISWWTDRLAGAPTVVELPLDRPRPNVQSQRGHRVGLDLGADLSARLEGTARRLGVTPFMLSLAAFGALLSRYGGQSTVVVGSPIANRGRAELEPLIGFFANTLALPIDTSGNPAFVELARRVREMALGAYDHQDVPFERLVDVLKVERSLRHTPVFQVVLALQNLPEADPDMPGVHLSRLEFESGRTHYDLSLFLVALPGDEGWQAQLYAASELFDPGTTRRVLGHFRNLLAAIGEGGETLSLSGLPLLNPEELDQILGEWNDTATPYPREATIHSLFGEQAQLTPEAIAVESDEESLTYAELDRRSNAIAARLLAAGVRPDDAVGLGAHRSANLIAALLGILKAGGAYVPLDPEYPRARIAGMVEDSGVRLLLLQKGFDDFLPETDLPRLSLEEAAAWAPTESPAVPVDAAGLAYVLFTSGSTGRPKGVAVSHRSVVRLVRDSDYARFGPEETVLQLAPVAFDASTFEIWGALLNGGRLVLFPPGPLDIRELGEVLRRRRVTTLWLTAGLFHQMVELDLDSLRLVRQLLAGGDALSPAHVRRALAALPDTRLINGYGPTEVTTFTTTHLFAAGVEPGSPVPVGRPIANTRVYVLDREMRPVPIGAPGELYAAGPGLARGYAGRPELTAERFVPDPVGGESGARLYVTGDLARWLPSGDLELLGRRDAQVKIRGFRIELGEVEAALAAHPEVEAAIVVAPPDAAGERRLVAYVVARAGADLEAAALRRFLESKLPAYMLPAAIVTLPELPLDPNGKVDRRALPDPGASRREGDTAAAMNQVEEILAGVWSELLGLSRVALDENFFELGGHSLLATRLTSRVRTLFGVDLPLRAVFEDPTLAGMAALIQQARDEESGAVPPPLVRVPRGLPLPASFAQQRLWFLDRLEPGGSAYNIGGAARLTGPLSVGALAAALGEIVRRHEALRTVFSEVGGEPRQVVLEPAPFPLPLLDLADLPAEVAEGVALRLAQAEVQRPYDLERGPLLRATLLRLDAEAHFFVLGVHHIVFDAWSLEVFLDELGKFYSEALAGAPAMQPALPVQYGDYSVWQRQWLQGGELERQLAYWRGRLSGAVPLLELPLDRPRPPMQTFRGGLETLPLDRSTSAAFRALGSRHGATLFMGGLAAFLVLLRRHTHQADLLVGTPVAGRDREELEGLIGFFVNTLIFRNHVPGEMSFADLLAQVRSEALAAFAHSDLPFERLVEELAPERSLSYSPLFQVTFSVIAESKPEVHLGGIRYESVALSLESAKFDLSATLTETAGDLTLVLDYNRDLFDPATVRRQTRHLATLLSGAAADPMAALFDLPMLSPEERSAILLEWNDTERDPEAVGDEVWRPLVHEMFSAHAYKNPEAIAAEQAGRILTYGELEAWSNRMAHALRALGAGPDVPVAICAPRTLERVAGTVAVLKAGSPYVSLDPDYPSERLHTMIRSARAPILLTERRLLDRMPEGSATLLCLDDEGWSATHSAIRPPEVAIDPENLAFVIFTSGSTGEPKGVAIPHKGLLNMVRWHQRVFRTTPADRGTVTASPAFDPTVTEIWCFLAIGGSVSIADDETRLSPSLLLRWWAERGVTIADLSTPMTELVLAEKIPPGLGLRVRGLVTGGDRLTRPPRPGTPFALVNLYGPAEVCVNSTGAIVPARAASLDERFPSIGRPLDGTRIYVLDSSLRPVPSGVSGEAFIHGVGLARGYLNQPDLTAERFLPEPWGALYGQPGARMYRTGDLVRWLPDGELDFLGRADDQVKLRGMRVELGEIEAALHRLPGVREAVVLARPGQGQDGEKRLVAYVSPPLPEEPLRGALKAQLPEHMIPSSFVWLEQLPLTPNQKIDRRALAAIEVAAEPRGEREAPRSALEQILADLWADLLGVSAPGRQDGFFELGGHSLLATRMISRVRILLGFEVPLRAVFESPTLAGFAAWVERELEEGAVAAAPPLVRVPRGEPLPASFTQRRLWFLQRLEPESFAYNLTSAIRLEGEVDAAALAYSLGALRSRHEALRTTFVESGGEPWQVIAAPTPLPLPVFDLSALPNDRRSEETLRLARAEAQRPYDLARGPLLRVSLIRLTLGEHALVFGMHHAISDGWSMSIFVRELGLLYRASVLRVAPELPELPIQFADFAVWQREWLSGAEMERQISWWTARLADAPQVVELPLDQPRPSVQGHRGHRVSLELGVELSARLEETARRLGVTPFMLSLAAFGSLLSRYGGQKTIVVGSPIANRGRAEIEPLIGFFANTLALPIDTSGDPAFGELAGRVRELTLGAYSHQDVPFERLVDALKVERSLSHSPVFQVVLALQNLPDADLKLAGLTLSQLELESSQTHYDLTLILAPLPDGRGLAAYLYAASELFDPATTRRLLGGFERLLEGIVEESRARLSELPLLSAEEREEVVGRWNRTVAEIPPEPVHRLVFGWAERAPQALAVSWPGGSWTYGDLAARARTLAARLRTQGVGPETVVALRIGRSPELLVAVIAVLDAGGAYLPIDPAHPEARALWTVEDAQAQLLLTAEDVAAITPGDVGTPESDSLHETPADDPERISYVIYTSGSTGTPKGTELRHHGLSSLIAWHRATYALSPSDRSTLLAGPGFDASVWETWAPLTAGASLHIPDAEVVLSPPALLAWMAERGITVSFLPTPLAEAVLTEPLPNGLALRVLLTGGDRLKSRPVPGAPFALFNHYGPTESTVVATAGRVAPHGERAPEIGEPIANTRVYLLDRSLEPVPLGVAGELCIAGVGLARGYRFRPELTARSFVPDPFAQTSRGGERLYRTGDLARRLAGGDIEFVGRFDHQVKIRGYRIELGEIEATLAALPEVEACAVVARTGDGAARLVGYVVGQLGQALDSEGLRAGLAPRLPAYMIPSAFVFLPALPIDANGKIDRRALPEPEQGAEAEIVPPRTPLESDLARVWAEVLKLDRVGIEDSFWDLGGHSLLATQVVSRLREQLGIEVALRALFEHPTIARLASHLEDGLQAPGWESGPPLRARASGTDAPLPLSFAQSRLWFLDQLEPGSLYNVPLGLRLEGRLDFSALGTALAEIVRRHEALRTRFAKLEGEPVQILTPSGELAGAILACVDLTALPSHRRESESRLWLAGEANRPFELAKGPLFRFVAFRRSPLEHDLLLALHHIVSDGWSMGVLLRELGTLYTGLLEGHRPQLPPLPVQYADFAVWQRERLQGETLEREIEHWRSRLGLSSAVLDLPTDRLRPAVQSFRGDTVRWVPPRPLSTRIDSAARALHATPFILFMTAFQAALGRWSGQIHVNVGTPIAGRTRMEIEGLIGFFVNTLVIRTDLTGDPSFADLARRVREVTLDAHAHQELPFEKLVEALEPERSLSHSPLFQVMLVLQNNPLDLSLPGLEVASIPSEGDSAKFDLLLALGESSRGFEGSLEFASDLFDRTTAARMLRQLESLLEAALENPSLRLLDLPLLDRQSRFQLLREWNDTAVPERSRGAIPQHERFSAMAARQPDRAAASFHGEELSYAELERSANRLAHRLLGLGVGLGTAVGVCLERSLAVPVALLAILKAGGVLLPLDPTYPEDRLAFMLSDAAAPVLLSEGKLANLFPEYPGTILHLEELAARLEGTSPAPPRVEVGMADLAYLIYTSGSTGKPKGTALHHGTLANLVAFHLEHPTGAEGRTLQFSPLSFDVSMQEYFSTWAEGGTLVLLTDEARRDPDALLRILQRERISRLFLPFVALNHLAEAAERRQTSLPRLKAVITAGEQLQSSPALVSWFRQLDGCVLENHYGPSETHVVTVYRLPRDPARWTALPPIGRPIRGCLAYLLDSRLRPVPTGVPGELYLGGAQTARGYLGRPDLTAEKFLPDPLGGESGARLYRTGDLARYLPDGQIEFLGRVDLQVKVRGFRIELGEIEAVLADHPAIREAVVAAPEVDGLRRLVAYLTPNGEAPKPAALRVFLEERLPDYMVPSHFMILETLPLGATGKVDRKALPLPDGQRDEAEEFVPPETPLEKLVAGIWAEVLKVDRVGLNDNFWDLGGHSLVATKVLARVSDALALDVPLRALFKAPTVADFTLALGEALLEDEDDSGT